MSREIKLSKGYVALISDRDYASVSKYKWFALEINNMVYAVRNQADKYGEFGKRGMVYLHRFLRDAQPGEFVDHKDCNGLNCQRRNIRKCTKADNQRNQRLAITNTSGRKGVSWCKDRNKWQVHIRIDGKVTSLGRFDNIEEADQAYRKAALKHFGKFARFE